MGPSAKAVFYTAPQSNQIISPSWPLSTLLQITTCCTGLPLVGAKGLINPFPTSCWRSGPGCDSPSSAVPLSSASKTKEVPPCHKHIWSPACRRRSSGCSLHLENHLYSYMQIWASQRKEWFNLKSQPWGIFPHLQPSLLTTDLSPLLLPAEGRWSQTHPCYITIRRDLCQLNPTSVELQSKGLWPIILFPTKYNWDPQHMDIS